MSRNNYRNYYKDKDVENDKIVDDVKDENIVDDVKDDDVKDENIDDIVEDDKDDEITTGVVVDCSKLNVRRSANKLAKVLTVIEKGTSVIIKNAKPSNGFYKVEVNGIEGYCVKDYIEIR